jgi:hypothetical protein
MDNKTVTVAKSMREKNYENLHKSLKLEGKEHLSDSLNEKLKTSEYQNHHLFYNKPLSSRELERRLLKKPSSMNREECKKIDIKYRLKMKLLEKTH